MCSLLRTVYPSQGDHGSGRKGPFPTQPICRDRVTLTRFSVPLIPNTRVCCSLIKAQGQLQTFLLGVVIGMCIQVTFRFGPDNVAAHYLPLFRC